ncbi:hypothetical protein OC25_02790 [Pedobacter kyungheensis]|uniref:Uncharacterized protein n=1 Tax=Pedobacter kyungheensis TaxID=1069985 RepID=A0A0C1FXX5_9SPHI|nr:hypothetical protein OC25_02790 [Pedobacter kyungheensis]
MQARIAGDGFMFYLGNWLKRPILPLYFYDLGPHFLWLVCIALLTSTSAFIPFVANDLTKFTELACKQVNSCLAVNLVVFQVFIWLRS